MKHFWLDDEQQALMDSATATAEDYGHIGLFSIGKAWKRHVEGMVGSKVEKQNYLRAYNVTGAVRYDFQQRASGWGWKYEVRALIRLTAKQAMMMKLRHHGDGTAWVRDDSTGEFWGNMLVMQASRKKRNWRERLHGGEGSMRAYLDGGSFGATVANVADHADGLSPEEAKAFVRHHFSEFDHASKPYVDPLEEDNTTYAAYFAAARASDKQRYGPYAWEVDGSAWSVPAETNGKRWAQDFWRRMQNAQDRRWAGLSDPAV